MKEMASLKYVIYILIERVTEQAICMIASCYYYDQNPSGFVFYVQISAFVI